MTKSPADLLQAAELEGITCELDGDNLKFRYTKSRELDAFIAKHLAPNKKAIVGYLRGDTTEPKQESKRAPVTIPAVETLDALSYRICNDKQPQLHKLGTALNGYEIGPGLLSVLGGPPGCGKTTCAMQMMAEMLEHDPNAHAVVANKETGIDKLLQRELVRQTGISISKIRFGGLTQNEKEQIVQVVDDLKPLWARVSTPPEPCGLEQLTRLLELKPGLLIVDYLQKFAPAGDAKQGVTAVMGAMRRLALEGWAILALSATSRTQAGKNGRSGHDSQQLGQASFRDSSEIEFNADSAYVIVDNEPAGSHEKVRQTIIHCVKNRHGEQISKGLLFNKPKCCFELASAAGEFDDFGSPEYSDLENPFAVEDF